MDIVNLVGLYLLNPRDRCCKEWVVTCLSLFFVFWNLLKMLPVGHKNSSKELNLVFLVWCGMLYVTAEGSRKWVGPYRQVFLFAQLFWYLGDVVEIHLCFDRICLFVFKYGFYLDRFLRLAQAGFHLLPTSFLVLKAQACATIPSSVGFWFCFGLVCVTIV